MARPSLPGPVAVVLLLGLLAGIAAVPLAGSAGGWGQVVSDYGLATTMACAAIAVSWRAASGGAERHAWAILAAGLWIYTTGMVVFSASIKDMEQAPFPSIADWLWLCLPVFAHFAFIALGRARGIRVTGAAFLDGLIVAAASVGVLAAVVYEPVFQELMNAGSGFTMVLPLSELVVVSALVVATAVRGWRPEPTALAAGAAFLLLTFGDSVYSLAAASTGWTPGTWVDLPYVAAMLLLGIAAWMPLRSVRVTGAQDARSLAIPLAAGTVAVVLVAFEVLVGLNPIADGAIFVLVAAVVGRMGLALRGWSLLLEVSQREAQTDLLTGLGNRRRLLADLAEDDAGKRMLLLFDLDGFKAYNDSLGHGAGDELLAVSARRLSQALGGAGRAYRMGGDEFCVLLPADDVALRARAANALQGTSHGFRITCSWGEVRIPDEAATVTDALRIADRRMYAMKNGRPNAPGAQLREALTRVVKIREPDLHEHVVDVGLMASAVARRLGLPEHEWADIVHGAELHDVGKLAIPEAILSKPGPLDDDEWVIMRRHTVLGEQLLSGIPALVNAARLVRSSHEAYDGNGYPDRLVGEEIPLGARIIAVCDAYDAMVTDRPYRSGMSHAEAVHELRRCSGSQFDPNVAEALIAELALRNHVPATRDPVRV